MSKKQPTSNSGKRKQENGSVHYGDSQLAVGGELHQIVPIGASAMLSSGIVKGSTLKVYPGLPHGMCSTHKDLINADLLAFFKA